MVTNLPDLTGSIFSSKATRGIIRSTLPGLIEEGFSGNKALQLYRSAGYKIRTSDFFELRRDVLGIERAAHTIQFVGLQKLPDTRKFAIPSWDLETKYMYTATYTEFDFDTGLLTKRGYSFKTNIEDTPDRIQDIMLNKLETDSPNKQLHRQNMRLVKAFRSG